jgi:Flp pilus assembly protein TadD
VQLEPNGEPIVIHELLSSRSDADAAALEAYARGMNWYEEGQFGKAIKALDEVLQQRPSDRAAMRLRSRCRALLRAPSAAWNGVWPLDGTGG